MLCCEVVFLLFTFLIKIYYLLYSFRDFICIFLFYFLSLHVCTVILLLLLVREIFLNILVFKRYFAFVGHAGKFAIGLLLFSELISENQLAEERFGSSCLFFTFVLSFFCNTRTEGHTLVNWNLYWYRNILCIHNEAPLTWCVHLCAWNYELSKML